jgi:glucose-1-phosphate adenylyltransferase
MAMQGENAYWRDIGTLQSYFDSNMDLVSITPVLNLYDREWPIRTHMEQWPPAKTVFDEDGRRGVAVNSIISNGAIISGSGIYRSLISPGAKINSYADIHDSIIMHGVDIGRHAKLRRTIIDKNVSVPENETIGYDLEKDRKRFMVTEEGITVIPRDFIF